MPVMLVSCASVSGVWWISQYNPQTSFMFHSAGAERMAAISFHFTMTHTLLLEEQSIKIGKQGLNSGLESVVDLRPCKESFLIHTLEI